MHTVTTFDMHQMLRDLDGDRSRLASLANSVVGEVPHHIRTMRTNLCAGRLDGLEFSARYMGMLFDSLLAQDAASRQRIQIRLCNPRERDRRPVEFAGRTPLRALLKRS